MSTDQPPECRGGDTEHQAHDDVQRRLAVLTLLRQPLRLKHPGGERRVGTDGRRAREQRGVAAEGEPGEQPEDDRAGQVDHQRPVREAAPGGRGHDAVDIEPQHGARTADHHDSGPDQHAHRRTRTLRTRAVARWSAAYPAPMLAAAYPAASPYAWALSIFSISTCIVENVDRPPH